MVNCELKVKGKIFVNVDLKEIITVKDMSEVDLCEEALNEAKADMINDIAEVLGVPKECVIISDFEASCVEVKE